VCERSALRDLKSPTESHYCKALGRRLPDRRHYCITAQPGWVEHMLADSWSHGVGVPSQGAVVDE